jgi:SAM-dependent methyltransferase
MRLHFCEDCAAVQITDVAPAEVLFRDYFYFSSAIGTLRDHFARYAREVVGRYLAPERATALEFGCNDGVLLRPVADLGVRTVIGVDPASNVVATIADPRITVVNDFFTEDVAAQIVARHGSLDLIMANNVYAHIPDIQGATRAVAQSLAAEGVFVFEVHDLAKVVDELQYDMIYHEHLYYYSLISAVNHFRRHGLVVFDLEPQAIHGGSLRFHVAREGSRHAAAPSEAVMRRLAWERAEGFDRFDRFARFAADVAAHRSALMALVNDLRAKGRIIAGYGASGRANTMIQWCGLDARHIAYMIDDAPAKQGFFTPGSHLPIRSSAALEGPERPDDVLVFAWSFFDEIVRRNARFLEGGGRMITPLPRIAMHPPA